MDKGSVEELNKVMDFNFNNSLSLAPMTVYCPHCMTLYSVNPHEILVPRPTFKCTGCKESFFINYPECFGPKSILGKPVPRSPIPVNSDVEPVLSSTVEAPIENFPELKIGLENRAQLTSKELPRKSIGSKKKPCPKCNAVVDWSLPDCQSCGIVLSKIDYDSGKYVGKRTSQDLSDLWKQVLGDYQDVQRHDSFIKFADLEENLTFANIKYSSLLEVNASDEIARKMQNKISSLALSRLNNESLHVEPALSSNRYFNLFNMFLCVIIGMCLVGYYFFDLKNTLGFLAFVLSLAVGMKFIRKFKM